MATLHRNINLLREEEARKRRELSAEEAWQEVVAYADGIFERMARLDAEGDHALVSKAEFTKVSQAAQKGNFKFVIQVDTSLDENISLDEWHES